MKPLKVCLILLCIVSISLADNPTTSTEAKHTTIVQGNHFYSNYQLNTTYNIEKVSTDRPIILILRKKDDNQVFDNNLTISLISGDKGVQCRFVSFNGMCYLDKLPTSNMTMKLKCDHLPCQASWTLLQPSLNKLKQMQIIDQLYDISESANHMIAMIMCNNPDIKNFNQLITTYSQSEYVRGNTNNIVFLLFKKQKFGHLYFKIQPAAKACAQMAIYNVTQELIPEKQLKDFVFANQSSIYTFTRRPTGQFRIDCAFHQINKDAIKSQLILKILGQKNGIMQTIITMNVKPSIPTTSYQFSFAVPNIPSQYTNLQLDARSSNNILIFNYLLSLNQRVEIEQSQHTHFKLKKGETLKFKLINQTGSDKSESVLFFLSKPNQVNISTKSCSKLQGCDFQVTALVDTENVIYAGKSIEAHGKADIIFFDFKDRITRKIRDQQIIYLRTKLKQDEVIRVVVNNPNVIVRASSSQKCSAPSQQCYQHIANSHHHFIYEPKKDGDLLLAVQGLDTCQFTISVIIQGTGSIQLKDGEPFSYQMDDKQNKMYFKFTLKEKTGVGFNLIAPLNQLMLVVNNGEQKPDGDQHTASTDGYISFAKQEVDSLEFRLLVQKTSSAKHKSVHFTLIASTTGANIRLDPGIAHIQSLKNRQYKDFVFEFDKKGDYIINFYTPNINKDDFKINLLVSNQDKWNSNKVQHMQITQNSDVLNLKDVSEQLCIEEGDIQCQIFLRVINKMDVQMDITVTLLVKDSVIQLKDGLWQTYAINTIAQTSHFYFLPSHKNSSVSILYKSTLVDIGIAYTLWKSEKQDIDPTQWPFPPYKQDVENLNAPYQSVNHIMIDPQNLKGCWPTCVILLSLYKRKSSSVFNSLSPNYQGNFSIMAANKVFQLPQKSRAQLMLKQGEQKYIMVDLKYLKDKQALTFFCNSIIGSYSLFANVYSQKNPRCPTVSEYDFIFGQIQTQIKMSSIKAKVSENNMDEDKDQFLCILATAYLQSKFTIQYTSDQQIIKLLSYDTFERFQIQPHKVKLYQLEAQQQYQIKFTREKGYFYVKIAICKDDDKQKQDMQICLEDLKSDKDRGKQIITKTQQFTQKPCPKCIVFIRIDADDPAEGIIHIQSQYSTVSLKQKDVISDFTNQEQQNKYSITSIQKQQTIISITVTEGDPIVSVTNYGDLNITKRKSNQNNNILIVIPPEKTKDTLATALGGVSYNSFAYSNTFRYLAVSIKSSDPKKATAYTISYSSGQRQTYLQDGLTVSYTLQPQKKTIFLYQNNDLIPHGYITISMAKSSLLFDVKLHMYTFADPNDEQTKVQVTPEKPPMRKKTPNPTIVYSLPVSKLVSIELQSDVQSKITLMILHQQLVILPFDQQFPFELHKNQTINLITDVNNVGFLLVTIRKCDQSDPDFGYTFEYGSFQKSQFEYATSLANDPKFQFYIKASKIGTLYMQMNSTNSQGIYSIHIHYSQNKIKGQKAKAGLNGVVQYRISDSKNAQINFTSIVCSSGSKCQKDVKYYWMAGNNLQDVYTQTVCPYSFFQTAGIISSQPLPLNQIKAKPNSNGVISFSYPYSDHITYLSVKAVLGNQQVYYQPLQIITMWGTVTRAGQTYYLFLIIGGICLLAISLICIRRIKKRNQYEILGNVTQDIDY